MRGRVAMTKGGGDGRDVIVMKKCPPRLDRMPRAWHDLLIAPKGGTDKTKG